MSSMKAQRILISPLNWGFGHAGRMIPVALELRRRGHEIIFAADSRVLSMLAFELPDITVINIPGVQIRYFRHLPQYLSILLHLPHIVAASVREHFTLRKLAGIWQPDIIISDNRFGFYHKEIFSVYVTHMVRIPFPSPFRFLEPAGALIHRKVIERFDLCLIPDFPGEINLSGRLSHGIRLPHNTVYTGPLSRFRSVTVTGESFTVTTPYRCLILSGPEPQRSVLKEKVKAAADDMHLVILEGTGVHNSVSRTGNVTVVSNPDTPLMKEVIMGSTAVISRSGYTTIMELLSLEKGAVIIPTPGQPEQEYLGRSLSGICGFVMTGQDKISGVKMISPERLKVVGALYGDSRALLDRALDLLVEKKME